MNQEKIEEVKKIWNEIIEDCLGNQKQVDVGSKKRRNAVIKMNELFCRLFELKLPENPYPKEWGAYEIFNKTIQVVKEMNA